MNQFCKTSQYQGLCVTPYWIGNVCTLKCVSIWLIMHLKQICISSEIYWFSIPQVKCGKRASNDALLRSRRARSLPKYWSSESSNTKYNSTIVVTIPSSFCAIATKDAGIVVLEDSQTAAPILVRCVLKCLSRKKSSIFSLLSPLTSLVQLQYRWHSLPWTLIYKYYIFLWCPDLIMNAK